MAKGKGIGQGDHMKKLDNTAIATLLGITAAELKAAERDGKSLATIAGEQNVTVQSVIDLITKQLTAALDKHLAAGAITQTQYDTQKAKLATKATELVNHTFSGKGGREVKADRATTATAVVTCSWTIQRLLRCLG